MTATINAPIVNSRGETTTAYRLMQRIIGSRLRKRYEDGPDRDDATQTALCHAWLYFDSLATSKPELTIEERAVLAARRGCWRTDRPVTSEPKPFRYVDAMDYVAADCDLFHLPAHAGRVSYRDLSATEATTMPATERDALIATLPAQLRPYATLAAQGVTQTRIAERRGESRDTVVRRMRAVKSAIGDMIAERETENESADWLRVLANQFADETRAENDAIRECNEHACLVVETDRPTPVDTAVSSSWDMFNSAVFSVPDVLRTKYNVPLPIMPHCCRLSDGRVLCG